MRVTPSATTPVIEQHLGTEGLSVIRHILSRNAVGIRIQGAESDDWSAEEAVRLSANRTDAHDLGSA